MSSAISDLPIRLAIDLVLREVAYTNPLPDWFVVKNLDYSARQKAIENRIAHYLDGSSSPQTPFAVSLPRKLDSSSAATWLQPSFNDIMILQTCVTSLAPKVDAAFDRKHVFSYRYNTDQDSTQLTENQCDAWGSYKTAIAKKSSSSTHILYLDLNRSFACINRQRFWNYLEQFSTSQVEIRILKSLIDGFAPSKAGTGIPLINNALFFLGNAYFSQADKVVAAHTTDYIRWNDDYIIFGSSQGELESLYKSINTDLAATEFRLNVAKSDIVQSQEYCDALSLEAASQGVSSDQDETDAYTAVPAQGPPDPNIVVKSLKDTVQHPDRYLNDGIGRAQLASLRKLRDTLSQKQHQELTQDLTNASEVVGASVKLLNQYMNSPAQTWRSVWLLFLLKDVNVGAIHDAQLRSQLQAVLTKAQSSAPVPVVKLWAKAHTVTYSDQQIGPLSDLSYEEVGKYCFGGNA